MALENKNTNQANPFQVSFGKEQDTKENLQPNLVLK